jgi:hypothetical protein
MTQNVERGNFWGKDLTRTRGLGETAAQGIVSANPGLRDSQASQESWNKFTSWIGGLFSSKPNYGKGEGFYPTSAPTGGGTPTKTGAASGFGGNSALDPLKAQNILNNGKFYDPLIAATDQAVNEMVGSLSTVPEKAQPFISGPDGVPKSLFQLATSTPGTLSPMTAFFTSTLPSTISPVIETQIADSFTTMSTNAQTNMGSLLSYLQNIPNETQGPIERDLSSQFAGAAENAAFALQAVMDWFTIQLPLATSVPITEMIPAQFNGIFPLSEPGLMLITDWFNAIPTNIEDTMVTTIPEMFETLVGDKDKKTGILGKLQEIVTWINDLPTIMETAFAGMGKTFANAFVSAFNKIIEQLRKLEVPNGLGGTTKPFSSMKNLTVPNMAAGGTVKGYPMGGLIPYKAMGGKVKGYPMGGLIPYKSEGGFFKSLGSDTVPAMLTPGEFVIRRPAVRGFGVKNLESINRGTFNGGSMYNYNLSVNVKSDANPEQIANTVMRSIKQVEGRRIRGNAYSG